MSGLLNAPCAPMPAKRLASALKQLAFSLGEGRGRTRAGCPGGEGPPGHTWRLDASGAQKRRSSLHCAAWGPSNHPGWEGLVAAPGLSWRKKVALKRADDGWRTAPLGIPPPPVELQAGHAGRLGGTRTLPIPILEAVTREAVPGGPVGGEKRMRGRSRRGGALWADSASRLLLITPRAPRERENAGGETPGPDSPGAPGGVPEPLGPDLRPLSVMETPNTSPS
ncbi:collagen alpha-1(XI) chain-like [Vombatus ursinus]|uniref:collagen alpha-1(XI) chain-like n=1 Tax=Vombatus ursinus TaxID=29139 RepID=UPI000FFD5997|nr:collagen alpha-1(XI) chain-like [Vombatus ursinus]